MKLGYIQAMERKKKQHTVYIYIEEIHGKSHANPTIKHEIEMNSCENGK